MRSNENRKYIIALFFVVVAIIFIVRLFYMQVIDTRWHDRAAEISEDKIITYPARGIVYDRNGKKLISNEVYYDIQVIPKFVENTDTFALAELLDISMEEFSEKMAKARKYSKRKPSELVGLIPPDEFAQIAPQLHKYPGFFEVPRTLRIYPEASAAHVLGYMNEVNAGDIERNPYYKSGDFIGRIGVERYYEEVLRGQRGVKYYLQDAFGRPTGEYEGGDYDTSAIQGKNITLSIDAELQAYGEELMQNKMGSIVAIDPKSGEILCMVSSPNYDPNLLVGRRLGKNYMKLQEDTITLPLLNRSYGVTYSPGSTFKLLQALIGLQEGVVTPNSSFPCDKSLVGCHNHPTAQSVSDGVKFSCNPYFYYLTRRVIQQGKSSNVFKDAALGMDVWEKYVKSFGFGVGLETDLPNVGKGFVPSREYYNRFYPEGSWAFSTIYSISIGQGEVLVNMLEMANFAAILANRGYYYYPHLIKDIEDIGIPEKYGQKNFTMVDTQNFAPVIEGMWRVVHEPGGTASRARLDSIAVCGKTGTVENFIKKDGKRVQLIDHSMFIAFAPKDDPQIAISVFIENSGFGGTWAAPTASLMIEKYINGFVKDKAKEQRIKDAVLMEKVEAHYEKNR